MTYITVGDDRLLRLRQVPKDKEMSKKKKNLKPQKNICGQVSARSDVDC